jgi:hypothetical protein
MLQEKKKIAFTIKKENILHRRQNKDLAYSDSVEFFL